MRLTAVALLAFLVAAPAASALPTPGLNGALTEAVHGRLFPEALETNDYISFDEAVASLKTLNERHPDFLEFVEIGQSVGWTPPLASAPEPSSVFSVEVTNEKSAVPAEKKLNIAFLIAVHGNEKGAREGALRVIEDFAAGIGLAEKQPDLVPLLDYQRLVFVFVNSDGWTHEEAEYRVNDACYMSVTCEYEIGTNSGKPGVESQNFVRVNGAGVDLNRQYPTVGFLETTKSYRTMEQPEVDATVKYLLKFPNVAAAADVHGMIENDNFFRILLKDGAKSQREFLDHARLAENLKQRLNSNPHYALYADELHVPGYWGGGFAEWAATFDAIGYSASGTGGAFVTQHLGLSAPGFTIEQAYSHIVTDNYYPGPGAIFNDYHVESMRDTVAVFMEFVRDRAVLAIGADKAVKVAWLATDVVVTSEDDDKSAYKGWFVETDRDDAYDIVHNDFSVSAADYWTDLSQTFEGASLTRLASGAEVASATGYDAIVVPGSAARKIANDAAAIAALKAQAEAGATILLTDEALQLLVPLGLVPTGAVDVVQAYSGYTDLLTRDHAFVEGLAGIPRVTYDANPLGFAAGECPVWYVAGDAFAAAKGDAVGAIALSESGALIPVGSRLVRDGEFDDGAHSHEAGPTHARAAAAEAGPNQGVNLGSIPLGKGRVVVFGAVLPDATEANPHPYGLDGYAVSITGNRILLNVLGLKQDAEVQPLTIEAVIAGVESLIPANRDAPAMNVPSLAPLAIVLTTLALALFRRRA